MALLERISSRAEAEEVKPTEKPAESPYLQRLLRRVENRELLEEAKASTLEVIESIKMDLRFINHVLKCQNCMAECVLDVERYGGVNIGLTSLNLNDNDVLEMYADGEKLAEDFGPSEPELLNLFKQMPKAENYRIGNYWLMLKGETNFETEKFIRDRLEWHRKILLYELRKAREHYRILLKWDLDGDPPLPYYRII